MHAIDALDNPCRIQVANLLLQTRQHFALFGCHYDSLVFVASYVEGRNIVICYKIVAYLDYVTIKIENFMGAVPAKPLAITKALSHPPYRVDYSRQFHPGAWHVD